MQRITRPVSVTYTTLMPVVIALVILGGCSTIHFPLGHTAGSVGTESPHSQAIQEEPGDQLAVAAQEQAQRLADALSVPNNDPSEPDIPTVLWVEHDRPATTEPSAEPAIDPDNQTGDTMEDPRSTVAASEQPEPSEPQPSADTPADTPTEVRPVAISRRDLLAQLRQKIRGDNSDPPVQKALKAALLGVLDHSSGTHSLDLAGLDEQQSDMVRTYVGLLTTLEQRMTDGIADNQWKQTEKSIRALFEEQSLLIGELKLCRSVQGFGVYEEINSSTLLVGREHPLIVYVELEGFESTPREGDRYEVRLSKQVWLHNEADDLVVWQEPKVIVVDKSRNRRRDFFLVKLIRLPARLSVGKYMLKVRVTDKANGSMDETSVPIKIVADRALAAGGGS